MRQLSLAILTLISTSLFAQFQSENLIRVNGEAQIAVQPDIGILNVELEVIDTSMAATIEKLRHETQEYTNILLSTNFLAENIRTSKFSVRKHSVSRRGTFKDSGYVASQVIRVKFNYSDSIINLILSEIASKAPGLNLNFDFELSEERKAEVQQKIIELAIVDAHKKAEDISTATGIKIKGIREIQYDYSPRFSSDKSGMIKIYNGYQHYGNSGLFASGRKNFNFRPEDLMFRDNVVIFFKI